MIKKTSEVTLALKKFHDDLGKAYNGRRFKCPICDYKINIKLVKGDCTVVYCENCEYAYCITCEYIYDPEPYFVSLLGYNLEKHIYFLWKYYSFDDEVRIVRFTVFENTKESFIRDLVEYIKRDYGRDNFTLEELVSIVDRYCISYDEVEGDCYHADNIIKLSFGDGITIEYQQTLFEVDPFF